ncbi:MAG TPA: response regulator, partial [Planctomycetota bacterium]|nr:response regulator [Planctomycetota bacterium]
QGQLLDALALAGRSERTARMEPTSAADATKNHLTPVVTQPVVPVGAVVRPRILVAEDNRVNQRLAQKMLEKLNCEALLARDGREAVAILAANPCDLVLMDCQMPVMDGFEATAAIRSLEKASGTHVCIIALTANAMNGDRERCLEAGMDDYISKPMKIDILSASLKRWLRVKEH